MGLERERVILAGLLHDIGKVIYLALKPGKTHQELGFAWGREVGLPEEVLQAILRHHTKHRELSVEAYEGPREIKNLVHLVAEADNIASAMERGEEKGGFDPNQGLGVVFDRVSLGPEKVQRHVWQPVLLEARPYPVEPGEEIGGKLPDYYQKVWRDLQKELSKKENLQEDRLLLLLEKYLSVVPESIHGSEISWADTSLYHHLKATAAIACCNFFYLCARGSSWSEDLSAEIRDAGEERYLLVGADLSGIQDFIYTIGSKAALKTVRARSFFLDLLVESAASQLLSDLRLGRFNLIYASGGGFCFLAPNTSFCRERIGEFRKGFNRWLYGNFGTQLYLCLAAVPLAGLDLKGETKKLPAAREKLFGLLGEQKLRKWAELLVEAPEEILGPHPAEDECQVCHATREVKEHRFDEGGEKYELCSFCRRMVDLGRTLPGLESFYEVEGDSTGPFVVQIYRSAYCLASDPPQKIRTEYRMRRPWTLPEQGNWPVRPFPTGAYIWEREFDRLAGQALGDKKIGALRIDVDRLGRIFSKGLEPATFARVSDLSGRLNIYFKYYLPALLEGAEGDFLPVAPRKLPVNLVYAGGDDLFLVGSWDGVLEAALVIDRDFRRYTGQNPSITVSAGLVAVDEKTAFYRLADLAGREEERAKEEGRNRVSLMGYTLTWEEAENLRPLLEVFAPELEQEGLVVRPRGFSRGFFNRFAFLVESYPKQGAWVFPQLYYLFARARRRDNDAFYRQLLAACSKEEALRKLFPPLLKVLKLLLRGEKNAGA